MATGEQRQKLLAVSCSWCNALPMQECRTYKRRPVTTLDGGCHDARWRAALGVSAPVLAGAVRSRTGRDPDAGEADSGPPEPISVGTALAERPW